VYANTNTDDTIYILRDSQCRVVFAEDDVQLAKLAQHRSDLPDLKWVVLIDGTAGGDWVLTFDDLAELGAAFLRDHPHCVTDSVEGITPDRLASVIYTSGTTGRPKGVRLRHESWVYQGSAVAALGVVGPDDLHLLWLPLAHSFGKVLLAAQLSCGFVAAVDGRLDHSVDGCAAVQPTFMAGVPRVFEKAYARILTTARAQGRLARALFDRGFTVGAEVARRRRGGERVPWPLRVQHALFDRLVFARVRQVFGGRIRFFVSGSAPLNRDIAEWFRAAGLLILEGYGLTETAGGAFINTPDRYRLGTVGTAFDGTHARIGDGGEVQLSGPNVMDGYHGLAEASVGAFTDDRWLRTGDMGAIDAEGFLTITGRIKEMFKTSNGKYVVPPAIESKFMALCPYASQFIMFGEARNYCVALISLAPDLLAEWATEQATSDTSYEELVRSPAVRELVAGYVGTLNAQLNRWETIKKWAILDHDLSVESGELTPSLKVKRSVVAQRYHDVIESLYPSTSGADRAV
jgi:long-chain acyl-CoA synthetase